MYTTAEVIWDGALDDERTFRHVDSAHRWAESILRQARRDGVPVEIWIVQHHHPIDDDDACACATRVDSSGVMGWSPEEGLYVR
jgi:hypothetical protein